MKRMEAQVGQIIEQLQGHQKENLPSEPEQAMCITIHQKSQESQSSEGNETENGEEEIPENKMPLYSEIKGEDIEEPKEKIVEAPKPSKTK